METAHLILKPDRQFKKQIQDLTPKKENKATDLEELKMEKE